MPRPPARRPRRRRVCALPLASSPMTRWSLPSGSGPIGNGCPRRDSSPTTPPPSDGGCTHRGTPSARDSAAGRRCGHDAAAAGQVVLHIRARHVAGPPVGLPSRRHDEEQHKHWHSLPDRQQRIPDGRPCHQGCRNHPTAEPRTHAAAGGGRRRRHTERRGSSASRWHEGAAVRFGDESPPGLGARIAVVGYPLSPLQESGPGFTAYGRKTEHRIY